MVLALGFLHFCSITGAASSKHDPACTVLIPSHSLVPYYYLLSADVKCVTTGSSSKIFCLVSEETPHAYNREFRCAFLHTRVNRVCYLFIYFGFNPEMSSVHFWPALGLSGNCLFMKWKYIQHQWCIYLSMKYQQLQWFISTSMHSAVTINNSKKKRMGLKLRKEDPVFWRQVPKQTEAASQLRSNASFQTCGHSLLVELFGHFSGKQHFYKEVKERKQHNFLLNAEKLQIRKYLSEA